MLVNTHGNQKCRQEAFVWPITAWLPNTSVASEHPTAADVAPRGGSGDRKAAFRAKWHQLEILRAQPSITSEKQRAARWAHPCPDLGTFIDLPYRS